MSKKPVVGKQTKDKTKPKPLDPENGCPQGPGVGTLLYGS